MLPLSATILLVYGIIGWAGKDYDMPVAVLSSLTLGLSVDFAIHFLQRARALFTETGSWPHTVQRLFAEPARAISRNAIVVAVGFLPLLASPLVPYNTVGLFLAAIMLISAVTTLLLLPAIMNSIAGRLFRDRHGNAASGMARTAARAGQLRSFLLVVGGCAVAAISMLLAGTARASEPTAQEIVEKANRVAYYAGIDARAEVRMTITDAQDRKRHRQFTILRRDSEDGGEQDYAVLFSRPADVRNTVFLVKKKPQGTDDRWLYLPDLDLVKRIAAGDKRTSFVGSHFFYEDISGRSQQEDTHELVETTDSAYVLRNAPRDADSVEFSYWMAWIDKDDFLPRRMEYFDASGAVYRRLEALEVAVISGHPTVVVMRAEDLRSGGSTIAAFRNVEYDLGIPESVFTERTLRNPAPQWFQSQ
jgi:outer membrane lipoprotein-sorting protein